RQQNADTHRYRLSHQGCDRRDEEGQQVPLFVIQTRDGCEVQHHSRDKHSCPSGSSGQTDIVAISFQPSVLSRTQPGAELRTDNCRLTASYATSAGAAFMVVRQGSRSKWRRAEAMTRRTSFRSKGWASTS